jgi:hypothetical protein
VTYSVLPLGEVVAWREFFSRGLIYLSSSILFGALFGFIFSILIYLTSFWLPNGVKLVLFLLIAVSYTLHELKILNLTIPQNHWQIPENWVNQSSNMRMFIWGMILGPGIFTYIPHSTFYIMYLYIGFFNSPSIGFIWGAMYGLSRTLPSLYFTFLRNSKITEECKIARMKNVNGLLNAITITLLLVYMFLMNYQII